MNGPEKDVVDDKGVDVYPVTSLRDPEAGDEYDAEKDVKVDVHTQLYDGVQRKMEQRHMQMIALAGTIGTGLFLNSGRIIAHGGPVGALLAFITTGSESLFPLIAVLTRSNCIRHPHVSRRDGGLRSHLRRLHPLRGAVGEPRRRVRGRLASHGAVLHQHA